ncbi:hypothetical protein JZK55_17540 [Dissulfurispira thermophila]|uniref:Uncharacterized protein n=1 Tax=Dissulfurispira thermophila TaxID=2715679 RepID=A0A7G1H3W7_9BACT|nr:hypothetical protein [Dissulfurispira thermophila]BCB96832.1 hypothetical protein JZK55_17540 [Dissulfurispira thermophila]
MKDFIAEGIKDLSIGLIIGAVIALLIEHKAIIGASIVFLAGIIVGDIALAVKMKER